METERMETGGRTAAIIPAGGTGRRFGSGRPKQFTNLAGWPILAHTLSRFEAAFGIDAIIVVVPYEDIVEVRRDIETTWGFTKVSAVVPSGETRQESVYQGFLALDDDIDIVLVHDAVRPLVSVDLIESMAVAAREHGAAIAAVPVRDTLKRVADGVIQATIERTQVWQAQTPQAFDRHILAQALAEARRVDFVGTDESILVERMGHAVHVVHGSIHNIKITLPEDKIQAEGLIGNRERERDMRIGMGMDAHTLVQGRRLVLGGVEIPFAKGLLGHSDADVMVHALIDALLGAAGLGDIGRHFPDTDPAWEGVSSLRLLALTRDKIHGAGFECVSADLTLLAQRPKIRKHAPAMAQAMAQALSIDPARINVKATTTEGLGFVGREEGLAAAAVALLARRNP